MPLVRINAAGDRARAEGDLAAALAALPPGAPVVVMIHGYKFNPARPDRCPHGHILSLDPPTMPGVVSWPRSLGFGTGAQDEGLAIAFGWNAQGSLWTAHAEAARAGRALSALIAAVLRLRRGRVHVVGHSLGARVALAAFEGLPEGAIGRTILLAAAATRPEAEAALATPAGRRAEIVNVRTRGNTLFDLLFRAMVHPHRPAARVLGAGLGRHDPRWLDLPLDCPEARRRLAPLGFRIPPPARLVCHWSAYLRPGVFTLYAALLREGLPFAALRAEAAPKPRLPGIAVRAWRGLVDPSWLARLPGSHNQPSA